MGEPNRHGAKSATDLLTTRVIKGLGHNLPPGLWSEFAEHTAGIVRIGKTRHRRSRVAERLNLGAPRLFVDRTREARIHAD